MPEDREQSIRYNRNHRLDEILIDGFLDGGRGMEFNQNGQVISAGFREALIFKSPENDPVLKIALETAQTKMAAMGSVEEKIQYLHDYVASLLPQNNIDENRRILQQIAGSGSIERSMISLGELIEAKTGVCRHRSLLFKALADEANIPASIVRGIMPMKLAGAAIHGTRSH